MCSKMCGGAASCRLSPRERGFIFARCSKGWRTRPNDPKNCASACERKPSNTGLDICTACSRVSTKKPRRKIAPRDTQKIIRAIEIRKLAGKPVGEIHRGGRTGLEGYDITKIGLAPPREALYARINARVETMVAAGWLDEIRGLIARGVPADAKPFQFIGYSDLSRVHRTRLRSHDRCHPAHPASHPPLLEATGHMVPQGAERYLASRFWRRSLRDIAAQRNHCILRILLKA